MSTPDLAAMHEHYAQGKEQARLDEALGIVEYERTKEVVLRALPPAPATVADIGGGPGRYALWLARAGYDVRHRDLVPLHVEQLAADARGLRVDTALGDARELDLPDDSVDAVLLLGPLYHLSERADRLRALREARRVVRPGGPVFAAAISRWAPRLHGLLVARLYETRPEAEDKIEDAEATGVLPPLAPGSFCGFTHRPEELREEMAEAGLDVRDLVSLEGLAFALPDLEARWADARHRGVLLDAVRAVERVPELLGIGPHLLATGVKPA